MWSVGGMVYFKKIDFSVARTDKGLHIRHCVKEPFKQITVLTITISSSVPESLSCSQDKVRRQMTRYPQRKTTWYQIILFSLSVVCDVFKDIGWPVHHSSHSVDFSPVRTHHGHNHNSNITFNYNCIFVFIYIKQLEVLSRQY